MKQNESEDIKMSLSRQNEQVAPTGKYKVSGEDVRIQEQIAPLQETINNLSNQITEIGTKLDEQISGKQTATENTQIENKLPPREVFENRVKESAKQIEKDLGYMPKNPTKESTYNEDYQEIAKVLAEEPKLEKKKQRLVATLRTSILDKGRIFEDVSLKSQENKEYSSNETSEKYYTLNNSIAEK